MTTTAKAAATSIAVAGSGSGSTGGSEGGKNGIGGGSTTPGVPPVLGGPGPAPCGPGKMMGGVVNDHVPGSGTKPQVPAFGFGPAGAVGPKLSLGAGVEGSHGLGKSGALPIGPGKGKYQPVAGGPGHGAGTNGPGPGGPLIPPFTGGGTVEPDTGGAGSPATVPRPIPTPAVEEDWEDDGLPGFANTICAIGLNGTGGKTSTTSADGSSQSVSGGTGNSNASRSAAGGSCAATGCWGVSATRFPQRARAICPPSVMRASPAAKTTRCRVQ